jgi:hypothetical protein
MVKSLLIRGMIAGAIAGVLAFGFAQIFGEPEIEYAIALEEQMAAKAGHTHDEELVSRATQAGVGLLTAVTIYGAGVGGFFAIAFALAYGRLGPLGPLGTIALLAVGGFVSVAVVPFLKYPAMPPAVGNPATLGMRTALFLVMIAISISAIVAAIGVSRRFAAGGFTLWSFTAGLIVFIAITGASYLLLPAVQEVPPEFSSSMLWRFHAASLSMQLIIWCAIASGFFVLTRPLLRGSR